MTLTLNGASVSEPHTSVFNCDLLHTSFRKSRDTLLTRNIAHAEYLCGRNIEKNVVKVNYKDRTQTLAASPKVDLTRKNSRSVHTYCTRTGVVLEATSEII